MASSTRKTIIVGIDFGTTFSGVAYAINQGSLWEDVEVFQRWPNTRGTKTVSQKVPTQLRLPRNGDLQWGHLISPDSPTNEVLEWFKLKLDERDSVAAFIPENIRGYSEHQTNNLIVDFLSSIGTEARQTISGRIVPDRFSEYDLKYVLTVPAIWSERATQRTKRALQDAMGIRSTQNITVISEPEAAAICELQLATTQIVSEGQCLMILDAGGGTVDLISYVVQQLHPLVVDEAVAGSGDVCGGATVTKRFENWLVSKIGGLDYFDDDVLKGAVQAFETRTKRLVNYTRLASNHTFYVPVHGLDENSEVGIVNEHLAVSSVDMISFFQPSIFRIKLLVAEQIAASNVPITAIIMVGGYGQCEYLREELEQDDMVNQHQIKVHQPPDGWTSVVRGAVMKGLYEISPQDSTRIRIAHYKARKHYGTELTVTYHDSIHAELFQKRRWDGLNGCYEVEVMDWFIKRGDPVTESRPFFRNFSLTSRVNHGKPQRLYLIIYTDETSQVAPLGKTETVRELCTVEADLSQIPESQMNKHRGIDGFMYFCTDGQIEILYQSQIITFTLIYNGRRYGGVNVDFL